MNNTLTLGPLVHSDMLGMSTPATIQVEGYTFNWLDEDGCYVNAGSDAVYLYIEDEVLTADSYYEIHTR